MVGTMQSSFLLKREAMAKAPPHEVGSTQRVRKLNSRLHSTPHTICLSRAHSYTKVFRETEGEPTVIRFARAYARTLEELPAYIEEGELLVGGPNCRLRSAPVYPEIYAWLRRDVDTLSTRAADRFEVTPQQVAEIKEITAYWQGKTIFDRWSKACPPELLSKVRETGWGDVTSAQSHGYHFTPPFEVILAEGISSYEQRVRDALAGLDNDLAQIGKRHFYEAFLITTAAIKNFAVKYSRKALELVYYLRERCTMIWLQMIV